MNNNKHVPTRTCPACHKNGFKHRLFYRKNEVGITIEYPIGICKNEKCQYHGYRPKQLKSTLE